MQLAGRLAECDSLRLANHSLLDRPDLTWLPSCSLHADAIPVKKGNMVLRRRLSAALVELMQVPLCVVGDGKGWQWVWVIPLGVVGVDSAKSSCILHRLATHPLAPRPCLCPPHPTTPHPSTHPPMQDGNASPILEWEKEFLSDNGVLASAELFSVVQAISYGSSQCSA